VKFSSSKWTAGAAFFALAVGVFPVGLQGIVAGFNLGPPAAQAQNLGMRAVYGFVVDADAKPVSGATVFIKYLKTKSIRSFTTQADGRYRFTGVNMAEDYEVWAEKDGKKSPVKTVSQWDERKEFESDLKLK